MLQSGEVLHTYIIVARKGNGSFGHVFEAEHTFTKDKLALKLLTDNSGDNDTRFRAENDHLHTLIDHLNIIDPKTKVLDIGDKTFYCMELADASVLDHISCNQLTTAEALSLFKEICEGIQHAHEKRIVHRDLHLGNVLLMIGQAGELSPRLTDFGRAKDFSGPTIAYIPALVWGAVGTWSPEIFFLIWDDADIDKYIRADLYALGLVLHSLLASDPLLHRAGLLSSIGSYLKVNNIAGNGGIQINASIDLAERQRHHQTWISQYSMQNQTNLDISLRQPDPALQTEINRIIQKCCDPDYNDRYMNVEELLQDVRAIC